MEFRILGPLEVVVAGRSVGLGGARHERILAALLLAAGLPVSRTRLVEIAYDDLLDGSRRQIQNRISALRVLLAKANDEEAGDELIVRQGNGYQLRTARDQVDAFVFGDLTAQARTIAAAGDRVGAARALRRALALWRGPALDGLDCQPLHRQVAGLEEARLAAWEDCLDLELATAVDAGAFVAELRTLAARHSLRQRLTALLMTALYRDGRQADALTAYRELAERLADEHGLDPGPDLQNLHRAILRNDVPRPPTEIGSLATTAPPVPSQLPADVGGFTGRAAELAALDRLALAAARQPRAVVISALSGTAGVGKTALAVHWGHRVTDRFPDGQLYVNLRGFDPGGSPATPAEAVRGFLDAFGVPRSRIRGDLASQIGLYRSVLAGKRVLVVLDNARDAEQVRPLLPGAPGCLALVTSRNQLTSLVAAEGAHPLVLDVLPRGEARQLLAARLGPDRVVAEPVATEDIITRCASLPLALAIVAARAATRPGSLRALADELRDTRGALDALHGGDAVTNVRAVFSWSYQTLARGQDRLFRLLGVHPGPDASTPAAASLAAAAPDEVRPLLVELTRAHLLVEHLPGRYTLHDLLRAYAADLAHTVDGEEQCGAATRRLLDHYLHTAYAAARKLDATRDPLDLAPLPAGVAVERPPDYGQALAWLAAERAVLLAMVDHALAAGLDTHAWQLAWTLYDFLDRQGHWQEQVTVQQAAVAATRRLVDLPAQARAHRNLANGYTRLRRFDKAQAELERAVVLCGQTGDTLARVSPFS